MKQQQAAIFDLDRTIVAKASGQILQRHLGDAGLVPSSGSGVADLLFETFNRIGESAVVMQLARFAARSAKDLSVDEVTTAAEAAAEELHDHVLPFALQLFDTHREAGRKLVLATTSPAHFVRPLAERLGFDAVIATEWETDNGTFTGGLASRFVWGRGKAASVKEWAAENGVSLKSSYAYSDSYFDAPLLTSVGHPTAVNPDPRLTALALLRGWPIRHFDAPPGVVKLLGMELQELMRPFAREALIPNARFEISGLENIPAEGGAIICGNHRSYFDSTVMGLIIAKAGRNARFLGKKEVFDAPFVGALATAAGGIRVERATGSDEPLERAADALTAGEIVTLMPQGTIPRGPAFFEPELKGRWGAARLAAMSRVPVIPVGLWGTEKVWPRNRKLPHLNVTDPPLITVAIGEPVELSYEDPDADTNSLMAAISALLPAEALEYHDPTDEELALTYPAGYKGDPRAESDRRPGTDS